MVGIFEPKFHGFSQNFMGNLLMCISQLPNVCCYHGNHKIKGDFCSFEYFDLLIIPNTPMCGSRKYPYPPHGGFFQFDPPTPQDFPFQRVSPYSPHPPEIPCFVFWSPLPLGKFISTKQKQESGHLCLFYHVRL